MEHFKKSLSKQLDTIIKYGIYLFALIFTLQTRLIIIPGELSKGYLEYNTISLYLSDILLIITTFSIATKLILDKPFSNTTNIFAKSLLLASLELTILASFIYSPDKILSIYKYGLFILGISLYLIISHSKYNVRKFYTFIVAGALIQSLIALYQFFFQSTFANKWVGTSIHDSAILGTSVIETLSNERWLRAYGTMDHPNIIGCFLATTILLLITKLIPNNHQTRKQKHNNLIISITFFILSFALLLTFSRAAWLGLTTGLFFITLLLIIQKKHNHLLSIIKILIIPLVSLSIFITLNHELFSQRFSTNSRLEEKSILQRTNSYGESLDIIQNHPYTGNGIGNYSNSLNTITPDQPSWHYQPVHNTFFLIWSEIGLFGMLFFIFFLTQAIYTNRTSINLAILFPILTALFFDHWLWSLHFGILHFWLILGIIQLKDPPSTPNSKS